MPGDGNLDHAKQISDDFKSKKSSSAWDEYAAAVKDNVAAAPGALVSTKSITDDLVDQGRLPDMLLQAKEHHVFKNADGSDIQILTMDKLKDIANSSSDPVAKALAMAMMAKFQELDAADGRRDGNINLTDYQIRHQNANYAGTTETFTDSSGTVMETISDDGRLTTFADRSSVEHVGDKDIYRDWNNNPTDVYENGVLINHYVYDAQSGHLVQYMDHGVVYKKYSDGFLGDTRWWPFSPGSHYPADPNDLVDLKGSPIDDVQINAATLAVTIIKDGKTIATESPGEYTVQGQASIANPDQAGEVVTVTVPLSGRLDTTGTARYTKNADGSWTLTGTDQSLCYGPEGVKVIGFTDSSGNLEFFKPGTNTITTVFQDGHATVEKIADGERTLSYPDGSYSKLTFKDGHLIECDNDASKINMHFDDTGRMTSADLPDQSHLVFNATTGSYDHMSKDGVYLGTVQGALSGATGELQFEAKGATDFVNVYNSDSWTITTDKGSYKYRGDGTVSEIDIGLQKIYCGADGTPVSMALEKEDGSVKYFARKIKSDGTMGDWTETQADFNTEAPVPGAEPLNQSKTAIDLNSGTITLAYGTHTDIYSSDKYTTVTVKGTDSVTNDGAVFTTSNGSDKPTYSVSSATDLIFDISIPSEPGKNDQVGWTKDKSSGLWTFHDPTGKTIEGPTSTDDPFVNTKLGDAKNGDVTFTLKDGSTVEYDRHGHVVETKSGNITRDFQYDEQGFLTKITPPGELLKVRSSTAVPPIYDVMDINERPTGVSFAISLTPDGVLTQTNTQERSSEIYRPNGEVERHHADGSWELFHADGHHECHVDGLVINYDASGNLLKYSYDDALYVVPDSLKAAFSKPLADKSEDVAKAESALFDFLNSDSGAHLKGMISDKDGYIAFAAVDQAYNLIGKTPPVFSSDEARYLTSLHDSFFKISDSYPIISLDKLQNHLISEGYKKTAPADIASSIGMGLAYVTAISSDGKTITKDAIDHIYTSPDFQNLPALEKSMITALHESYLRLSPDGTPISLDDLAKFAGYDNWQGLAAKYTTVDTTPLMSNDGTTVVSSIVTTTMSGNRYALEVDYTDPPNSKLVVGYQGMGTSISQIKEADGTKFTGITDLGGGNYSFTVELPDGTKISNQHANIAIDAIKGTIKFDYGNGHTEFINADGSRLVCDGAGQPTRTIVLDHSGRDHVKTVDYGNGKKTEYSYDPRSGDLIHVTLPNGLVLDRLSGQSDFTLTPPGIQLTGEQFQLSADGKLSIADGKAFRQLVASNGDVSAIATPRGLEKVNPDGTIEIDNPQVHNSKILFDPQGRVIELDSPPHTTKFNYDDPNKPTVMIDGVAKTVAGDALTVGKDGSFSIRHADGSVERFNADGSTENHNIGNHSAVFKDAFGNVTKVVIGENLPNAVTREFVYAAPPGPNAKLTQIVEGATCWEPDPAHPNLWLRYGRVDHERILDANDQQQSIMGPVTIAGDGAEAGKVTFGSPPTLPFESWNTDGKSELHKADNSVVEANANGQITKITLPNATTREFTYQPANDPNSVIVQIKDTDGSIWKSVSTTANPSHWMHFQSADPNAAAGNPPNGHFNVSFADSQGTLRIQHTDTYGTLDVFTTDGKVNGHDARNIIDAPADAPVPVAIQPTVVSLDYTKSPDCLKAEAEENSLSKLYPWDYTAMKDRYGRLTEESLGDFIKNHGPQSKNYNADLFESAQFLLGKFTDIKSAAGKTGNYIEISDLQAYVNRLNDASIDAAPKLSSEQKSQLKRLTDGMASCQVMQGDVPMVIGMKSLKAQGFENPTPQQAMLEVKRIMRLNGWDETNDPGGRTWTSLHVGQKLILQVPDAIDQYKQAILNGTHPVDLKQLARDAGVVGGENDLRTGDPNRRLTVDKTNWTTDTALPAGITHKHNPTYPYNDETTFADKTSIVKNTGTGKLEVFSADGKRIGVVDDSCMQDGQFKPRVTGGKIEYAYKDTKTGVEVNVTVENGVTAKAWQDTLAGKTETDYQNGLVVAVGTDHLKRVQMPNGDEVTEGANHMFYYRAKGMNAVKITGVPLITSDGKVSFQYSNPQDSADLVTVNFDNNRVETVVHAGGKNNGLVVTKYPNGEVWTRNGTDQKIDLPNGEIMEKTETGWHLFNRNMVLIADIDGQPSPDLTNGEFTFKLTGDDHVFTVSDDGSISCQMTANDTGRNAAIERLKLLGIAKPTDRDIMNANAKLGITVPDHPYPSDTDVVIFAPGKMVA